MRLITFVVDLSHWLSANRAFKKRMHWVVERVHDRDTRPGEVVTHVFG